MSNLNSQKGFSALGIFLFIAVMIAIMNFAGFFNLPLSPTGDDTKYEADKANQTSGKRLSISDISFKAPTPTPAQDSCNHDMSKKADPDKCQCVALFFRCENNKCVEIDKTKSNSGFYNWTCQMVDDAHWCEYFGKDGDGWYCVGKPVIYLYPEVSTVVNVNVKTAGPIFISDPQIEGNNSWTNVLAHPDGTLYYKNNIYKELFYESQTKNIKAPNSGLIVKSTNLKSSILDFIKKLGLTKKEEQDEFLDWWLPRLNEFNSPYWMVSILDSNEKQRIDNVNISPKPDTFIEFIVYFKPLDGVEYIKPLDLPDSPERKGFTAIEWGGVIDK